MLIQPHGKTSVAKLTYDNKTSTNMSSGKTYGAIHEHHCAFCAIKHSPEPYKVLGWFRYETQPHNTTDIAV